MTATPQPSYPSEPPPPQRGLSREERGRDVSEAQAELEAETSKWKQFTGAMNPRFVLSMADGYPVVLKQFIQFCLIIIYPAWVFAVLCGWSRHTPLLRHHLPAAVATVLACARKSEEEPSRGVRGEPGEVREEVGRSGSLQPLRRGPGDGVSRGPATTADGHRHRHDRPAPRRGGDGDVGVGLRQLLPLPLGGARRLRSRGGQRHLPDRGPGRHELRRRTRHR